MPEKASSKPSKPKKAAAKKAASRKPAAKTVSEEPEVPEEEPSLLTQLIDATGRIGGSLREVISSGSAIPLFYSENWLTDLYLKSLDPNRLAAMQEAGELLKDAREVAGLSINDLAEALGLKDTELLDQVEGGHAMLPFDIILRIASLVARHDPIPFILKFLRTYNPTIEKHLTNWGVAKVPKHFERERRLINIYRRHDALRDMSDTVFERLLEYQESSLDYALAIMDEEKQKHKKSRAKPK